MAIGNVYTSAGEAKVIDLMDTVTWYIGWGTGTTTPDKGDAALETESAESRVATTDTQPSADVLQMVAEMVATGTRAITEVGVLDAASAGSLLQHHVHAVNNLTTGESIEYTVTHEQA